MSAENQNTEAAAAPEAAPETGPASARYWGVKESAPAAEEKVSSGIHPVEQGGVEYDPEPEPQARYEGEKYDIRWPDYLPISEQTPERQAMLDSFAAMAPEAAMPADFAQTAFEAYLDVSTAIPHSLEVEYATAEDAAVEMSKMFGEDAARALIGRAQALTKNWPSLAEWLEESKMGNDPSVIATLAIAQTGAFGATPEQAQARIDKLTKDQKSDYYSQDKSKRLLAVAEVNILARIAHREVGPEEELNAAARAQAAAPKATGRGPDAMNPKHTMTETQARQEIAKMMTAKGSPLMSSGHPEHRQAVARYHELLKLIP